jgi:hypothetical protein
MAHNKQKSLEILIRRNRVSELYFRGVPLHQIAQQVGVVPGTVTRDLQALEAIRIAGLRESYAARKARELAKLDELERTYWAAYDRSCRDKETVAAKTVKGKVPREEANKRIEARDGNPDYLRGVERCIELRCRITKLIGPEEELLPPPPPEGAKVDVFTRIEQLAGRIGASLGGAGRDGAGKLLDSPPADGPSNAGAPAG